MALQSNIQMILGWSKYNERLFCYGLYFSVQDNRNLKRKISNFQTSQREKETKNKNSQKENMIMVIYQKTAYHIKQSTLSN